MLQKLLQIILSKRSQIILLFQLMYGLIVLFLIWGTVVLVRTEEFPTLVMMSGNLFGKASLLLFILVTIPGIARRFRIAHPVITLIMSFRRYIGITVALFALAHASVVYFIPTFVFSGFPTFPLLPFMFAGSLGLSSLLLLMITSNDRAVAMMGKNWKRLHRLVYVIFWFIFAHVALQGEMGQAILIGGAGLLEIASFVFSWVVTKPAVPTPPASVVPSPQSPERNV